MSPLLVSIVLCAYFLALIAIAFLTSRNATSDTFFTGNRQSRWYLVAFGMIGTSLSGVTFISVPGSVEKAGMSYFQVVLGYLLGYVVIAQILMPLYYKLNLVSIYEYLKERFGKVSYKTGASIFIVSRTVGSAMRLFMATEVLQLFLFDDLGVPYWMTTLISILLIWAYTFKGGVKTIVYTDSFQTIFLISAVIISIFFIADSMGVSFVGLYNKVSSINDGAMTKIFFFEDYKAKVFFPKQFFGGMFLAIVMTGLDQDLMQKNLTCKNIKEAQKNMYSFTVILVLVNFLFLLLGGALYAYSYANNVPIPADPDHLFPILSLSNFGPVVGVFFLLGITASTYASSDSALTALTTGFCIDFLNFSKREEKQKQRLKLFTHIGFSLLFLIIVIITKAVKPADSLIDTILFLAAITYGPLLGLFSFGILTKRMLKENLVPVVCILAPVLAFTLNYYSKDWLNGYQFGSELLIVNGLLTFLGLYLISKKEVHEYSAQ